MSLEYAPMHDVELTCKLAGDGQDSGTFRGYGSVFGNIDDEGDIIEAGAFQKMRLKSNGRIRITLGHNLGQIIGDAEVAQDSKGLKIVKGSINLNLSYTPDVFELMSDGSFDSLSAGFRILPKGVEYQGEWPNETRVIKKAELWEVAVVPFGMNRKAKITSLKSALAEYESRRDLERALRDGTPFSRKVASAIAAGGFKALQRDAEAPAGDERDAQSHSIEKMAELRSLVQSINV